MSTPVSIVVPALADVELFERHLPPLFDELERRGAGDEVVVVDDTGERLLPTWFAEHFPSVRVVARSENGGFARALSTGIAAARHALVLAMNSDVRIRRGFLEPLIAALDAPGVFAAVPVMLLDGRDGAVESLVRIEVERGLARVAQPALEGDVRSIKCLQDAAVRVPFAVGGACLFRRDDFERLGGFDPAFEPFYLEDLDLGWRAWQAGEASVLVPSSVVEHHHRGTIGAWVGPELVRAAIERNLLLFQWKHMDAPELLREHLAALAERAATAWFTDDREVLVWIALALERAPAVLAARAALAGSSAPFADIARDSDAMNRA